METPFAMLMEIKKDLTIDTNLLAGALNEVNDLKSKNISQEAYIVLMMSFLIAKELNNDFFEYLQYVSTSNNHSGKVKASASEILRQRILWPDELMDKDKH